MQSTFPLSRIRRISDKFDSLLLAHFMGQLDNWARVLSVCCALNFPFLVFSLHIRGGNDVKDV